MILYADLETYSEVPISSGAWAYAEGAEVMLWAWAIDDQPAKCWDVAAGEVIPEELEYAIEHAEVVVGFNWGNFDDVVLTVTDFTPRPPLSRVHDVMVQAHAHSLPGKLETLGQVLGVPQELAKIKDGKRLINLFCKPRPAKQKLRRATQETHPEEWERFKQYAINDVEDMRWCYKHMPRWNYPDNRSEYDLWQLDQKINRRGIKIDMELVDAALEQSDRIQEQLAIQAQGLTGGAVGATTQRDKLIAHLADTWGIEVADMQGATVEKLLELDLPSEVAELLVNRQEATRTSIAKYRKIKAATSSDGHLRGLLQFAGASRTGRWAGRLVQPQNFVRPPKRVKKAWEDFVRAVKVGSIHLVDDLPMEAISGVLRGVFVGEPLDVSDLANIEGRLLAWLAGEEWKLQAFREYDAGVGEDLYRLSYARSFQVSLAEVLDEHRQVGKVQELALGYEGGVGAYVTFALVYGLDLVDLSAKLWAAAPKDIQDGAVWLMDWLVEKKGEKALLGLPPEVWLGLDCGKRMWREAHPATVKLWADVQDAFRRAVREPGVVVKLGRLAFRRDGNWVRIRLPSGRFLCYPGVIVDEAGQISYKGINQYSRKWQRLKTYGGKLVENIVQAIARDVLSHGMVLAEDRGVYTRLSVHDELICTSDVGPEVLGEAMSTVPPWADGLPLAAAGFRAHRYRKD